MIRLARRGRLGARGLGLLVAGALLAASHELEAQRGHGTCDAEDQGAEVAQLERRSGFEVLRDVSLSQKVEDKLSAMAASFRKRSGKTFVVTSGTRAPDSQAGIIFAKLSRGEDLSRLYKDKSAVAELKRVFDDAKAAKRSRDATIAELAAAIRAQMKRGIFVSAHLRAGAADIRSTTMDAADKKIFVDVAREVGGVSVMHEASPPHFHIQLE